MMQLLTNTMTNSDIIPIFDEMSTANAHYHVPPYSNSSARKGDLFYCKRPSQNSNLFNKKSKEKKRKRWISYLKKFYYLKKKEIIKRHKLKKYIFIKRRRCFFSFTNTKTKVILRISEAIDLGKTSTTELLKVAKKVSSFFRHVYLRLLSFWK